MYYRCIFIINYNKAFGTMYQQGFGIVYVAPDADAVHGTTTSASFDFGISLPLGHPLSLFFLSISL